MKPEDMKYEYCLECHMTVRHILKNGRYVCQNCGHIGPEEGQKAAKCPSCGEITKQCLRGWEESYTKYRCGHCQKAYQLREDEEDVVMPSQLGFNINDEETEGVE